MLWTIFVILLILWLLGMVTAYTFGGLIHIILVIALVVLILGSAGLSRASTTEPEGEVVWYSTLSTTNLERAVGEPAGQVKLREPEADGQIVRGKLAEVVERRDGLAHHAVLGEQHAVGEDEAGLVERPGGVEHCVPVAVFAELVGGNPFGRDGRGGAGLQGLVVGKVDGGGDVVGIENLGVGETFGGGRQLSGALKFHAPVVQRAGIIAGDQLGVGVDIRLVVQVH